MDGIESILHAFSGKGTQALRKTNFSFRGMEVESSYALHHQAHPQGASRSRSIDVESMKKQMFAATISGDYDLLRDILEAGISVNLMEPRRSDTPLMIACRAGHTELVRLCLHYGAKNDPHPDFGHTALHAAVLSAQLGTASILLDAAAASDADTLIVNLTDVQGQTPLHIAAETGLMSMMEMLMSHGADIHRKDGNGRTALHICAVSGHKKCLAVLLDHSGDTLIDQPDSLGNAPLHCAAENGQLACTRLLLESAANVDAVNRSGKTPYSLANTKGHFQVAQVILEYHHASSSRGAPASPAFTSYQAGRISSSPSLRQSNSPVFESYAQPRRANDESLPRPHTAAPSPKIGATPSSNKKVPLFDYNISASKSASFKNSTR
jgi:ankyrin repeat protein